MTTVLLSLQSNKTYFLNDDAGLTETCPWSVILYCRLAKRPVDYRKRLSNCPCSSWSQSIKTYFLNDDDFNWNLGVAKAATGKYKEAEETLLQLQNEKYRWGPRAFSTVYDDWRLAMFRKTVWGALTRTLVDRQMVPPKARALAALMS